MAGRLKTIFPQLYCQSSCTVQVQYWYRDIQYCRSLLSCPSDAYRSLRGDLAFISKPLLHESVHLFNATSSPRLFSGLVPRSSF